MEVIMNKDKETKNTIRFAEETEDNNAKNLYLLKSEVNALGNPQSIKVTIEAL